MTGMANRRTRRLDRHGIRLRRRLSAVRSSGAHLPQPVDFFVRTRWFLLVDREFRFWTTVLVVSTAFAIATLSFEVWVIGGVGATLAVLAVVQWAREWTKKAERADRLKLVPEPASRTPVDYEGPYRTWLALDQAAIDLWLAPDTHRSSRQRRNAAANGVPISRNHVITNARLNRRLRADAEGSAIRIESADGAAAQWLPGDPCFELWKDWGGRPYTFSELKARLASDLLPDSASVVVQTTDYNAYIVTNNLALERMEEHSERGGRTVLSFRDIGLHDGRIRQLFDSRLSNHLGGDLLLVEPGEVKVQLHSRHNKVFPEFWAPSASGSFDEDRDLNPGEGLVSLVKRGLARELHEEMRPRDIAAAAWGRKPVSVGPSDIIVTGYARASYTGGKPQFYGVARSPERLIDLREKYVRSYRTIEFSQEEGVPSLVRSLKAFLAEHIEQVSPSLIYSVWMLEDWWRQDKRLASTWLGHYWTPPIGEHPQ